ncbi:MULTISPECIES: hypothetical protein [Streptomyces]|uniref:hypothetical protein n=1 Tax=Streptomyces TaxID=1883 RepID=UPI003653460D
MPTSDDQLKKKQDSVKELRAQLAAREAEVLKLQRAKENDVTASQLDTEAEQLKAAISAKNDEIKALGGDPDGVKVPKTRSTTSADEALKVVNSPVPEPDETLTPAPASDETKKEG